MTNRLPLSIEINISPNAIISYENNIQHFGIINNTGKYTFKVFLKKEIENNNEFIDSNTIEFEVVE